MTRNSNFKFDYITTNKYLNKNHFFCVQELKKKQCKLINRIKFFVRV